MDELSLFGDTGPMQSERAPALISERQREELRAAFTALGIVHAKSQFALVAELTGQVITSPQELESSNATVLLAQLRHRVANAGRANTGDSWADRDEPTWIDNL